MMSNVGEKNLNAKSMVMGKRLNRDLWYNIARLKLMNRSDAPTKFILVKSPFSDFTEEEIDDGTYEEQDEYLIIGRIFPRSEIYKNGQILIEIIVGSNYPEEPPRVRFLTPIYHPNIEHDGKFCHQLISHKSRWVKSTTLVEVIEAVVNHLDNPDPDYAVNYEIGEEYLKRREEFIEKAKKSVEASLIPEIVEIPTKRVETELKMEMNQTENFETVTIDEPVENPMPVSMEIETTNIFNDETQHDSVTIDHDEETTENERTFLFDFKPLAEKNCTIC